MRHLLTATALSLASVASHANGVPTAWQDVDTAHAIRAIVVADVAAGGVLPMPDECTKGLFICLDSSFWYRADVRTTLAGTVPEQHLNVITLTHQGMRSFLRDPGPRLLVLETLGDRVIMPKYRSLPLAERRDGELFLIDHGWGWPTWLPCATQTLRETLDEAAMPRWLLIEPEDILPHVEEHRDLYHWTPQGAFPRYGIAVSRLAALMATLKASGAPMDCPRPEN